MNLCRIQTLRVLSILPLIALGSLRVGLPFQERERIIVKKSDFNPPVWIKRAKVKKGVVQLGKSFEDDDDWLRGFTIGVLNASNKTVTHVSTEMLFRHQGDSREPPAAWFIEYGVNPLAYRSASETPASTTPSIMPGGEIELTLGDGGHDQLVQFLSNAGFPDSIHAVEVRIHTVGFSDGTIWSSGKLLRRDANNPGKWSPINSSIFQFSRFIANFQQPKYSPGSSHRVLLLCRHSSTLRAS